MITISRRGLLLTGALLGTAAAASAALGTGSPTTARYVGSAHVTTITVHVTGDSARWDARAPAAPRPGHDPGTALEDGQWWDQPWPHGDDGSDSVSSRYAPDMRTHGELNTDRSQ